ncbi:MAG: alpha/beta fold hydrolase, partial [Nocardioides sp.]
MTSEYVASIALGIELCYQTAGDPAGEPLLLLMGLGGPMTWWDPRFCDRLVDHGFYVIRFDNRDVGRSTKVDHLVRRSEVLRGYLGLSVESPYTLTDMAYDAFALLDFLGLTDAHLAGLSMGGMIAQTMAITEPNRVRSLTSMMSTTGRRTVGWQDPRLGPTLLAPRGAGRDAYVEASSALWRRIGSPAFPTADGAIRQRAEETHDRGFSAAGVTRQMLAIVTQPDRTDALRELRVPALIVHGTADRMIHLSGGRATAAAIANADLMLVDG